MKTIEQSAPNIFSPVETLCVALHPLQSFTRQQKARLLQLVPDLRTIQPEEAVISPEQRQLMAYFQKKLDALPERHPMQDDDIFLSDVTVGEFFALPEPERSRLWEEAHIEAEREFSSSFPQAPTLRFHSLLLKA